MEEEDDDDDDEDEDESSCDAPGGRRELSPQRFTPLHPELNDRREIHRMDLVT